MNCHIHEAALEVCPGRGQGRAEDYGEVFLTHHTRMDFVSIKDCVWI
jgi:hypothetical protein